MADTDGDHKEDTTGAPLNPQGTPETAPVPNPKVEEAKAEENPKEPDRETLKGLIKEVLAEMTPDTTPTGDAPPAPASDTKPTGVPWTHRGRRG